MVSFYIVVVDMWQLLILFLVLAVIFVEYRTIEPFHRGGHGGRSGGHGGYHDRGYGRYGGDYGRGYGGGYGGHRYSYGGGYGGGWNWGFPMWYVYDRPYPITYGRSFFY